MQVESCFCFERPRNVNFFCAAEPSVDPVIPMLKFLRYGGQFQYRSLLLKDNRIINLYFWRDLKNVCYITANLFGPIIGLLCNSGRNKNQKHVCRNTYNNA